MTVSLAMSEISLYRWHDLTVGMMKMGLYGRIGTADTGAVVSVSAVCALFPLTFACPSVLPGSV